MIERKEAAARFAMLLSQRGDQSRPQMKAAGMQATKALLEAGEDSHRPDSNRASMLTHREAARHKAIALWNLKKRESNLFIFLDEKARARLPNWQGYDYLMRKINRKFEWES